MWLNLAASATPKQPRIASGPHSGSQLAVLPRAGRPESPPEPSRAAINPFPTSGKGAWHENPDAGAVPARRLTEDDHRFRQRGAQVDVQNPGRTGLGPVTAQR